VILRIGSHLTRKPIGHDEAAGDSRNGAESVILVGARDSSPARHESGVTCRSPGIVTEVGGSTSPCGPSWRAVEAFLRSRASKGCWETSPAATS